MAKYRRRIFEIISIGNQGDWISRAFDYCIVTAIILNITVLFLETFDSLKAYMPLFNGIEYTTVLIFVIEYALRIYTAPELYDELPAWKARLRFLISFDGVVDLLTILPFFFLYGFSVFRILRVVRIFHLFRLNTNYDSFHVITSVLYRKRNQLISSIFILLVLLFASSLCMYSAEHEAQPELFQNAFSGIWYSLNTIFTVGYGDIYPITKVGRFMGAVITFLGVGAVAIPTGIISAGFVEEYQRMAKREDDDALRNAGKAGAVAVQPAAKTISEEKLRVVRATTLAEQAGAYYVRIEAMARQYHIKAEQEFDRYDRPNTRYIVLKDEDFPIGTCRLIPVDKTTWYFGRVVVLENYRGLGLGRRVVEEAENWARELGGKKCILDARDEMVGFYEKMGYVVDRTRVTYGEIFTCIRVEKIL